MPPSHSLLFSFDPLGMSKLLKIQALGLPGTKNQEERTLTKHVVFIYAYVKKHKNRNSNDEEDGDKQKKQGSN